MVIRIVLSRAITTGTGDSTIPKFPVMDVIKNIDVQLPSLEVQKRIGKILTDNLQQQLKLLYDYRFTQFDFPDENGKLYKSSGGVMVSKDKVSYKVPNDWGVCNLFENPLTTIIKPGIEVFDKKLPCHCRSQWNRYFRWYSN